MVHIISHGPLSFVNNVCGESTLIVSPQLTTRRPSDCPADKWLCGPTCVANIHERDWMSCGRNCVRKLAADDECDNNSGYIGDMTAAGGRSAVCSAGGAVGVVILVAGSLVYCGAAVRWWRRTTRGTRKTRTRWYWEDLQVRRTPVIKQLGPTGWDQKCLTL